MSMGEVETDVDAFEALERRIWARSAAAYAASVARLCAHPVPLLLDAAGVRSGSTVLDVGTGTGTAAAAACARGARVTAVDAEPGMLAAARRTAPEARVRVATLPELPFPDGAFDAVVGNFVLNHVGRPGEALAELRRVLRPGGLLMLTIRDYDDLRSQRITSTPPQVSDHEAGRAVTFQLWHWHPDGERYDLEHFQLVPTSADKPDTWDVRVRRSTYWALTRAQLSEFVTAVGFGEVTWHEPAETGFYQPILTARR